jgi:hypothetical protein
VRCVIRGGNRRGLADALGLPVVFSAEPAGQPPGTRGLVADTRGPGIGDEPDAAAIIAPLRSRPGEHLLANVRHNAFPAQPSRRLGRAQRRGLHDGLPAARPAPPQGAAERVTTPPPPVEVLACP